MATATERNEVESGVGAEADTAEDEGTEVRDGMVGLAQLWAWVLHSGQVDKAGCIYLGHPRRVARTVEVWGFDDEYQTVAWLHDVLEDADLTWGEQRDLLGLFPVAVRSALRAITHPKGESYSRYLDRVVANPIATVVKYADLLDNSAPSRVARLDGATAARLASKYQPVRTRLERVLVARGLGELLPTK